MSYISDACLEAGNSLSRFEVIVKVVTCQVDICVMGTEVNVGRVGLDNVTDESDADAKKYGPQDRALGNTTGQGFRVRWGARYRYMLNPDGQVGLKPCQGGS